MHKLTLQVPVYQFRCIIIIDDDIEKKINSYNKRYKWNLKKYGGEEGDEVYGLAVNLGIGNACYLFYSIDGLTVNTLTHEVSHLVDYVLVDRGIEDPEARAYLSGYLNEKIFDYVLKNNLLINKWLLKTEKIQVDKESLDQ